MIRGVIFDLGSTLIRFSGDWSQVLALRCAPVREFLGARGYTLDARFDAIYRRNVDVFYTRAQQDWVEYTAAQVLRTTLAELGLPAPDEDAVAGALAASFAQLEAMWEPYPDAHAVLAPLQAAGYRLGLVSNAGDNANVQRLIDAACLRPYFDPIIVSAAVGLRKPNPRLFHAVADRWGLPPAQVAVVGDTLGADVLGAQFAGMRSVWATMDAGGSANAAHVDRIVPDAAIKSLSELPGVLGEF